MANFLPNTERRQLFAWRTNVGEIDTLCLTFFADILSPKSLNAKRLRFIIFGAKILAKNARVKC